DLAVIRLLDPDSDGDRHLLVVLLGVVAHVLLAICVVLDGDRDNGTAHIRGTIRLPSGASASGIILRFAYASGMPMIVRVRKTAVIRCVSTSHRPATMNHNTFPIAVKPPARGSTTISRPNGQIT